MYPAHPAHATMKPLPLRPLPLRPLPACLPACIALAAAASSSQVAVRREAHIMLNKQLAHMHQLCSAARLEARLGASQQRRVAWPVASEPHRCQLFRRPCPGIQCAYIQSHTAVPTLDNAGHHHGMRTLLRLSDTTGATACTAIQGIGRVRDGHEGALSP